MQTKVSAPTFVDGALDAAIRERLADVAGDDPEFIGELVEAFIAGGEETLHELRAAAHRNEHGALARAAHKLKGASANLHVNGLTALTQELEVRAKEGGAHDWSADVAKIAVEFERVADALRTHYGDAAQRKAG